MGGAIHADDLRTTATSSSTIYKQDEVINSFVSDSCLKLNTAKFEVVKISPYSHDTSAVQIGNSTITTSNASKCLGVWWNSSLSAKNSVSDISLLLGDLVPSRVILIPYLPAVSSKPVSLQYCYTAVRRGCSTPPLLMP